MSTETEIKENKTAETNDDKINIVVNEDVTILKKVGDRDKEYNVTLKRPKGITELSSKTMNVKVKLDNSSSKEIENIFMDSGYSRLPIHNGDIDQIVGTLYQKDFYHHVIYGSCKLEDVVRPAFFTSKYKPIGDLLKELQHDKQHIAIVIDEYGCTAGLVTMEDILEEIVGDIWDEYDVVSDDIVTLEDGTYQVAGTCNVEELFDFLGHKKEFDVITVNGWLMEVLGHIPAVGDVVEEDGFTVTVTKSNGRRAEQVHVVKK